MKTNLRPEVYPQMVQALKRFMSQDLKKQNNVGELE